MDSREQKLARLAGQFDVLVVGGGATGLGIAVDAATRGYRTLLVEAGDFAQATSSRATKLVHGGVRYLASGQFPLVYEALRERRLMWHNAPHLVAPLGFVTPAYRWWELPYYGAGLKLYDWLSASSSLGPTRILGANATRARVPGIAAKNLKGSILYHDGQFDDARFALALARTAEDHGATVLNYMRCAELVKEAGKLTGAVLEDVETGARYTVGCGVAINATGIFSDTLRQQDDPGTPRLLSLSRGTHIVVGPEFLGGAASGSGGAAAAAIMVPKTPDGRIIFAIPWQGKVVIGTTDIPVADVAMEPGHDAAEVRFLLETINPYLARPVTPEDILSVFSGLRPLVTGSASNTSKLSREHHIDASASGLVTVAGGKWTTYRRMAEQTLDFAAGKGLLPAKPCRSRTIRLRGAPTLPQARATVADPLHRFGTDAAAVRQLAEADTALLAPLDAALPFTGAEVVYAARYEMARTVEDVLARRARALLLDAKAARRAAPAVAALLARELGHNSRWAADQVAQFERIATAFYAAGSAANV